MRMRNSQARQCALKTVLIPNNTDFAERTRLCRVVIIIPTGAMGNSAAGLWCVASGLPVYKLVLATNANDAVVRAVRDAMLERQPMAHTVSEAMNTQLPYNFERLLHLAANGDCSRVRAWMAAVDRNEPLQLEEDVLFWLRERLLVGAADNEKTLKCIRSTWAEYAYAIDPHTAVGLEVLAVMRQPGGSLAEDGGPPLAPVCLATAHPCKVSILRKKEEEKMIMTIDNDNDICVWKSIRLVFLANAHPCNVYS